MVDSIQPEPLLRSAFDHPKPRRAAELIRAASCADTYRAPAKSIVELATLRDHRLEYLRDHVATTVGESDRSKHATAQECRAYPNRPLRDINHTPIFKNPADPQAGCRTLHREQDLAFSYHTYSLANPLDDETYREYHVDLLAHAPNNIPIFEGPMRGPQIKENGDRRYGYVRVSGKNPQAYDEAQASLRNDPALRSIWMQLEDGATFRRNALTGETTTTEEPEETHVATVAGFKSSEMNNYTGKIQWNTIHGWASRKNDGRLAVISPARVLGHEGVHRFNSLSSEAAFHARFATPAGRMYNLEENDAMTKEKSLGDEVGQRDRYDGFPVKTKNTAASEVSFTRKVVAQGILRLGKLPEVLTPALYMKQIIPAIMTANRGPGWKMYGRQQIVNLNATGPFNRKLQNFYLKAFTLPGD